MLNINNSQCQKDLTRIRVKLEREIICDRDNNEEDFRQMKEKHTILRSQFLGVQAGKKESQEFTLDLSSVLVEQIPNQENYNKYTTENEKKKSQDYKLIMENILPSCKGELIQVNYTLKVQFSHSAVLLGNKLPKVSLPIWVVNPQISTSHHQEELKWIEDEKHQLKMISHPAITMDS